MKSMIKSVQAGERHCEGTAKGNSIRQLLEQAVCDVALKADENSHIEMACEDSLKPSSTENGLWRQCLTFWITR